MELKDQLYPMRDFLYARGLRELILYINSIRSTRDMTMIEIGSYAGESTEIFAQYFKKVIAIDPFINDYDPKDPTCQYMELTKVFDVFNKVMTRWPTIELIRKTSDDAIVDLKGTQVDFVYIDGLHTYDQVKKDIINYFPLIYRNGLIGGHDYHPVWQGVKDAIGEMVGLPEQTFVDTSWIKQVKFLQVS